ncbi:MAG: hypothetical protein NZ601_05050 [candidate division WOR-3 bacterium]|nr:hypothetical protein [candidate division WOR-3 bacterium]MCX7757066.1 hypothetical protein [candidate division WOR-3 bacterium]MDW7987235.1 hypothetical protein [candidate division WOR-3 bacterium]
MEISWQIHLAKENIRKTILVGCFLLFVSIFFIIFYGIILTLVAWGFLFITLNAYFLPTKYTLTETEVIIDKKLVKNRLPWSHFKKYYITNNGVVLSPFSRRNFLDNFRGLHLILPKTNQAEIIEFIKQKLDKQENLV